MNVDEEAVNKLNEKEIDSIKNFDDDNDIPWSIEQETGRLIKDLVMLNHKLQLT